MAQYKTKYPEEAAEFEAIVSGDLPEGWEKALPTFTPADKVRAPHKSWRKLNPFKGSHAQNSFYEYITCGTSCDSAWLQLPQFIPEEAGFPSSSI